METDPESTTAVLVLPQRLGAQSLLGYTHQHFERIDELISFGVKYSALVKAIRSAGFEACRPTVLQNALSRARKRAKRRPRILSVAPQFVAAPRSTPSGGSVVTAAMPATPAQVRPPITAEQLRKSSTFQYKGTANLDPSQLL